MKQYANTLMHTDIKKKSYSTYARYIINMMQYVHQYL